MKRVLAAILVLALAGCAADPAKVEAVADQEADRLASPSRPLSEFGAYELAPMSMVDAIRSEAGKLEEAQEFEGNLKAKVQPLLDQWNGAASGSGKLLVKVDLVGLRIVSGGARFWAGGFAGDSFIDLNLVLEVAESGEQLSNVRVYRDADAITGGWSIGKSDQNLDDYVVSIIHEYLADNY